VTPSGLQGGLEDVLIIIDGVHGTIPDALPLDQPVHLLAPPGADESSSDTPAQSGAHLTDMDRAAQSTRAIGEAQGHKYGDKSTPAPNYNLAPQNLALPNGPQDAAHPPAAPLHP
jgi:hypothetical protein